MLEDNLLVFNFDTKFKRIVKVIFKFNPMFTFLENPLRVSLYK